MKRINAFEAKVLVSALDALCPDLPLDDAETYELLSKGETDGIYMLESDWDKYDLQHIQPRNMEELVATVALSHSPRMNPYIYSYVKRTVVKPFTYPTFPVCQNIDEVLKETRGMIIYKEQVEAVGNLIDSLPSAEREKYRLMIHILNREIEEKKTIAVRREFCAKRALDSYKQAYLKVHYAEQFNEFMMTREGQGFMEMNIPHLQKGNLVVTLTHPGYAVHEPSALTIPHISFPSDEQMKKHLLQLKMLANTNGQPLQVNFYIEEGETEQESVSHVNGLNVADVIAVLSIDKETGKQSFTSFYPNREPYFYTGKL